MPRVTLSPEQQAHAREIAEKAARVMEEKPESFCREMARTRTWDLRALRIDRKWWRWSTQDDWTPYFALDGTDPDEDAKATARMKARLIEWGAAGMVIGYASSEENPWRVSVGGCIGIAPLEVLAVAQALIAVDEERRK